MSISRKQRAKFRKTFKLGLNPFDKSKRKQKEEKGSDKRKWRRMLKKHKS